MVLEVKNTFCRNVTIYGHCRYENSMSTPLCQFIIMGHVLIQGQLAPISMMQRSSPRTRTRTCKRAGSQVTRRPSHRYRRLQMEL